IGIADTMMLASSGEAQVGGASLITAVSNLFFALFQAFATGGAVVVSQYLGRKDNKSASKASKQLIYITFTVSSLIMALGLIFKTGLINAIYGNIEKDVFDSALSYSVYILISFPFLALMTGANALFRSMGRSRITMTVSLLANIVNLVGNAVFIFIFHLGAAGAGLATMLSRLIAATILLIVLSNKELEAPVVKLFRPEFNSSTIKKILMIGLPTGFENSIFHIGKILVQSLVASFGTISIVANAASDNITSLVNIPSNVIGIASITIIGQCIGAERFDEAIYYARKLIKYSYIALIFWGSFIFLISGKLLSLYSLSPEADELAMRCIHLMIIQTMLFWPLSFEIPQFLRASGDVKFPMVVAISSMWTFRVILAHILGKYLGYGLYGVYWAMCVDWYFRITMYTLRWKSGRWKTKSII
ncbi:MAG: MATE family efflux transporter, partial [Sphaerochaetaceae bacterium]|nr:MATE family efflux transporter [Sphaerochaetaceae bacterium]